MTGRELRHISGALNFKMAASRFGNVIQEAANAKE